MAISNASVSAAQKPHPYCRVETTITPKAVRPRRSCGRLIWRLMLWIVGGVEIDIQADSHLETQDAETKIDSYRKFTLPVGVSRTVLNVVPPHMEPVAEMQSVSRQIEERLAIREKLFATKN